MIAVCDRPMAGIIVLELNISFQEGLEHMVTYDQQELRCLGIEETFVQENQSKSQKNVLRGMHFQQEYDQAQIVRVLKGEAYDVVVDVRRESKTFGKYYGVYLTAENRKMIYMSKGFAHGFLTLSDELIMHYKCSQYYHPEDEAGIRFDDAEVAIPWPIGQREDLILSEKDLKYPTLQEYVKLRERKFK